jgi:leucyl aminopeptidase
VSPELSPFDGSPATADADAVVIGLIGGDGDAPPRLAPGAEELDTAFEGHLAELLAMAGATGKADEVVKLPTRGTVTAPLLVAVGLGKAGGDRTANCAPSRSDGRPVLRRGRSRAPTTGQHARPRGSDAALAAAAEGSLLGAYAFTTYRTNGNRKAPLARLSLITDAADANDVIATATAVGGRCHRP